MDHRQVDDPLDPGLAGKVEGDQGLGEFVRHHGVQQEQGGDSRQGVPQGVDIEEVALDHGHARRKLRFYGVADECADIGATLDEVVDDVAADGAGRAGDEDGHGGHSKVVSNDTRRMRGPLVVR